MDRDAAFGVILLAPCPSVHRNENQPQIIGLEKKFGVHAPCGDTLGRLQWDVFLVPRGNGFSTRRFRVTHQGLNRPVVYLESARLERPSEQLKARNKDTDRIYEVTP